MRFFEFLKQLTSKTQLYIIGDLFDQWQRDSIDLAENLDIIQQLRNASDRDIEIFFQTGNRDFMLGKKFFKATKITKLPDFHVIKPHNILITHGDLLCTDDVSYLKVRKIIQNPVSKFVLNNMPERWLKYLVNKLRSSSRQQKKTKTLAIMDTNINTIEKIMLKHKVTTLVHGHTHRPNTHDFKFGTVHVLIDWQAGGRILTYDNHKFQLKTI